MKGRVLTVLPHACSSRVWIVGIASLISLVAQPANAVTISFTTTITPNSATSPGSYAGESSVFYLPYTAANGSVNVTSALVQNLLGTFLTDSFGTGATPNPNVTPGGGSTAATQIRLTITPTVGSVAQAPLTFYGEITNPATNIYCLDFATTYGGPFNTGNCHTTSGPAQFAIEGFDNNRYEFGVQDFILINSPTKTTNLVGFVAPYNVPEPVPAATTGLAVCAFLGFALRRKLQLHRG